MAHADTDHVAELRPERHVTLDLPADRLVVGSPRIREKLVEAVPGRALSPADGALPDVFLELARLLAEIPGDGLDVEDEVHGTAFATATA